MRKTKGDVITTPKELFPIVAIGSSAGGLEALDGLFRLMPSDSGTAFILVSHLDPGHESLLSEILQRVTKMPVTEATDKMLVEPNHLYVIPPNRDMAIVKGELQLRMPESVRGLRMPIDYFFRSLADDRGERAIAILLSGTGTDGTMGLRAILGAGGVSFIQEPSTAQYDGMPDSAIQNGLATYVLPVPEMPGKLAEYVVKGFLTTVEDGTSSSDKGSSLTRILSLVRNKTGNDFSQYKQNTIRRRLHRRMISQGIDEENLYAKYLADHPGEIEHLFKEFLINVTSFFRDPESYETLRKEVLPSLLDDKPDGYVLRVWVPGCATGEEAYSLAILFREYMIEKKQDLKVLIYATDIDGDSIALARPGKYPPNVAMDITPDRLNRFFIREDRDYRVKKEIRDMVVFAVQNVIKDPPFTKLDLISCRNLLIYLEVELQNQLIPLFQYALRPGGVLVLGPSESIGASHDSFSTIDRKWRIFRTKNRVSSKGPNLMNMPLSSDLFVGDGRRSKAGAGASLPDISTRIIMKSFGPPSVVTDEGGVLLYVHGETGNYLQPSPGHVSLNVVDMARPGLDMELRAAIQNATMNKTAVTTRALKVIAEGGTRTVDLVVNPFSEVEGGRSLLLISFLERGELADAKAVLAKRGKGANARRSEELERELSAAKENLQSIVEQMQGSHEELKSTNEELQSTNEELQSTNEELETSKEELQSVNEELISVNSELQAKNLNLLLTQSDLKNLLDNTNIGAIFLDENLIIRRFTRDAFRIFRLVATDVGRSLGDIKSRVEGEDLMEDVRSVMEYLVPRERTIRNSADEWFLARVLPYRTVENSVIGIVLTFIDITELKKIDSTLRKTEARFDQMTEQSGTVIWEADADGLFTYVSSVSDIVWGYRPEELVGKLHFYDLVVEAERETIKSRVFEIAKHGERFVGMEHAVRTRDGRILWNSTSGIPLLNRDGTLRGYQGSDTDITARK
ncbi:MAG: chemotaxis protein CheB, partial [Methanomassiliicoccales archaeon]